MDELIQSILEDVAQIAEVPAAELSDVKAALQKMGVALHASLADSENPEEDAEALEAIADRIDAVNERLATVEAEEALKAERLAAAMDRIGAVEEDTPEEVETLSDDADEAAEVAEPVAEDSDDDVEAEEPVTEEAVVASAPKVSAGTRARLANINKAKPAEAAPAPQESAGPAYKASLVAGGAVETGPDQFTNAVELAEQFISVHNRVAGIGKSTGRHQVAKLNVQRPATLGDNSMENYQAVNTMRKELERGKTDALTASGGFCAPAEVMYDFFDISSTDGLLQLPTMTARRGKVSIPDSASVQDILGDVTAASWGEAAASTWTNANDITPGSDGPATKPCYHIQCATFADFEVEARVLCLTFGNFQQQFYPELVADTLGKTLVAHEHLVNAGLIADLVALATSTGPIPSPGGGALSAVLGTLAFKAAQYREKYRMPRTATLTAVLPYWVRDAMIADYVRRASTVDPSAVDGAINSYFSARGINPQWVYDWQGLADDQVGGPKVEFPATADILLYAEGTVVRLDAPTLDFGIVRDSTLNSTNDWQQFVEQFVGLAKVGHEVMLIENVETCPTGETGQAIDLSCIGS